VYSFGDVVRLTGDILSTVKPWDDGKVMVQDKDQVLVEYPMSWGAGQEYFWLHKDEIKKM